MLGSNIKRTISLVVYFFYVLKIARTVVQERAFELPFFGPASAKELNLSLDLIHFRAYTRHMNDFALRLKRNFVT